MLSRRTLAGSLAALSAALLFPACGGSSSASSGNTLNWYIFPEPSGAFAKAAEECSKASGGEYDIQMRQLPADADGQREEMVRRLAAEDDSLDILGLDVTWTAEFAEAGWIEAWPDDLRSKVESSSLDTMIETSTWKDELFSAPFNTNTQLLWYRKDLVQEPPKTWDEMIEMAEKLADEKKPHLIEIQGAQYEGFTVWLNTMISSAGGSILNEDGTQAELGEPALKALQTMRKLADSVAADPSLPNQMENENRLAFESGTAAFQLNYPFVYPSAKDNAPDIFKNMAWAPYPSVVEGEPSHVTIGGIDLAVSSMSRKKEQAFKAIQCLREPEKQVRNAVDGGLPPVTESVYKEKDFQKSYPFWETALESLKEASVRPLTPAYQSVSLQIAYTLSPPTSIDPENDIAVLTDRIQDAIESKGLVP
ncbi:MAG: trehalose/maltose transport system substrate-binding protein [Actinomycetota bacterium]|nr:trehalose/maltose transport system substrate-binding protein [Actinomycetota bacterium]